jgi:hypothetical protein
MLQCNMPLALHAPVQSLADMGTCTTCDSVTVPLPSLSTPDGHYRNVSTSRCLQRCTG